MHVATFLLLTLISLITITRSSSPNVLILLVDDMGYSDTAAFGSTNVSTPHIDNLLSRGL